MKIPLLPGERLWGGRIREGTYMPYTLGFSADLSDSKANQVSFLLLSSQGRVIHSPAPFRFQVEKDCVLIQGSGPVTHYRAGSTLRDAYRSAMARFYPRQETGILEDLFRAPQFNTWIELVYNQNQRDVLAYAERIAAEGFVKPRCVLMIDDNWQEDYGLWRFHPGRFPDPAAMMAKLHALGFRVMLWVCPFVSPDSLESREMAKKGLFVRNGDGSLHIAHWWNGYSALLDLSNPEARDWFASRLDALQSEYGVDGFKFDAGSPLYYPADCLYHEPGCSGFRQTQLFSEFAARYPLSELRETCDQPQLHVCQRLCDKAHSWTEDGLATLIPCSIAQSLMGYQMICPDMIGGGEYQSMGEHSDRLDQELIVRSAQASALLPMMQFSAAPWRILDEEHYAICRSAAALHTQFSDYILQGVRESLAGGDPVVQPMEYAFPGQGLSEESQQFMLGEKLLVAPVVIPGARTRCVALPTGHWRADDGTLYEGGARVTVDAPLSRLPYFWREE